MPGLATRWNTLDNPRRWTASSMTETIKSEDVFCPHGYSPYWCFGPLKEGNRSTFDVTVSFSIDLDSRELHPKYFEGSGYQ